MRGKDTTGKLATRRLFIASTTLSLASALSGCSAIFSEAPQTDQPPELAWIQDGLLAIARPVPPVASTLALRSPRGENETLPAVALDSSSMLGFMPLPPTQVAAWLSIDTARQTVSLMSGQTILKELTGEGLRSLTPGTYSIAHKQESPLWYAPDSYFEARGLSVPPEGDRARFRRGALGERAIFLDKNTPLHNGPIWSAELGGVKLADGVLEELYAVLEIGSTVEVR